MNRVRNNIQSNDDELIGVLTAISVVSRRLANKLIRLGQAKQSTKGVKKRGQNERNGNYHQRTAGYRVITK